MRHPQVPLVALAPATLVPSANMGRSLCRLPTFILIALLLTLGNHAFAQTECSDGVDNDSDGFVDLDDFNCADSEDDTESPTQCSDGIDNDSDGFVDLDDFDCQGAEDTTEGSSAVAVPVLSGFAALLLSIAMLVLGCRKYKSTR